MLVISTQNWSILVKFARKNPAKLAVFYWLFLGEVFPPKFPMKLVEFSFEILIFSDTICEIGRFVCEFWLFSHEIGWFFREFWLFSHENPTKSTDFSANLPLKIPRNFAFFSAKYQKLWKKHHLCENLIPVHWLANNMTSQADVRLCKLGSS